jgi:diguanylate cyclase (GGDEF)-like protein
MGERLRESVREDMALLPGRQVTVSVGVVVCEDGGDKLEALYNQADARLYRAKQSGRDRVCADDDAVVI